MATLAQLTKNKRGRDLLNLQVSADIDPNDNYGIFAFPALIALLVAHL
jgi:hypothetical protein